MGKIEPVPVLFLVAALIGALFTLNAFRPLHHPFVLAPSFFAAWLTAELSIHHLVWQAIATALFIRAGALDSWPGWVGLALTLASWAGLVTLTAFAVRAGEVVEDATNRALGAIGPVGRYRRAQVVAPFPIRHRSVRVRRHVVYRRASGRDLKLDIYCSREPREKAPVLIYIHGGAWVLGFRDRQGLPLMHHLAAAGWVCVSPEYRLSPGATFPDHLVDVKAAIAWVRAHAGEFGADPDRITIAGGSAGGHLVALAALTANDPEYQPGFADADTAVAACVPIYGVFDFTNRLGRRDDEFLDFLEKYVMKASLAEDPVAYEKASPVSRVHAAAPPFFVIQGRLDTLAPVEEARAFVDALRAVSREPVVYAEFPGAHHAFDIFPSIRTGKVVTGIERFLKWAVEHAGRGSAAGADRGADGAHDADAGRRERVGSP